MELREKLAGMGLDAHEQIAILSFIDEERLALVAEMQLLADKDAVEWKRTLEAAEARCAEYEKREQEYLGARDLDHEALTARYAKLAEALWEYMSQFGQGLEAHGIPFGPAQVEADKKARAALAAVKEVTGGPT